RVEREADPAVRGERGLDRLCCVVIDDDTLLSDTFVLDDVDDALGARELVRVWRVDDDGEFALLGHPQLGAEGPLLVVGTLIEADLAEADDVLAVEILR